MQERITALEKEKRQRDFQYATLESLLKKTKSDLDTLRKDVAARDTADADKENAPAKNEIGGEGATVKSEVPDGAHVEELAAMQAKLASVEAACAAAEEARARLEKESTDLTQEKAELGATPATLLLASLRQVGLQLPCAVRHTSASVLAPGSLRRAANHNWPAGNKVSKQVFELEMAADDVERLAGDVLRLTHEKDALAAQETQAPAADPAELQGELDELRKQLAEVESARDLSAEKEQEARGALEAAQATAAEMEASLGKATAARDSSADGEQEAREARDASHARAQELEAALSTSAASLEAAVAEKDAAMAEKESKMASLEEAVAEKDTSMAQVSPPSLSASLPDVPPSCFHCACPSAPTPRPQR